MKTIEQKAAEYVANAPNRSMYDAYLAGANEALASQWRDVREEKPEDGEEILMAKLIIPPASRALRTPLIGYIADKFRSEYEHGGFGYSEVTHWLPIPGLPTLKPTEK